MIHAKYGEWWDDWENGHLSTEKCEAYLNLFSSITHVQQGRVPKSCRSSGIVGSIAIATKWIYPPPNNPIGLLKRWNILAEGHLIFETHPDLSNPLHSTCTGFFGGQVAYIKMPLPHLPAGGPVTNNEQRSRVPIKLGVKFQSCQYDLGIYYWSTHHVKIYIEQIWHVYIHIHINK